jgi:predicted transcriptional regulator
LDKWFSARGLKPATAAEILERADERRIWYRLLHSEDEAIALRTVMYLTDRRDGRAAQQINVTSLGLTVSADDVAEARAIVRELRGDDVPTSIRKPHFLEASTA